MAKKKEPAIYFPVTKMQSSKIMLLQHCIFYPGSFDKRFVYKMNGVKELTAKQSNLVDIIFYKYRVQIARRYPNTIFEKPKA